MYELQSIINLIFIEKKLNVKYMLALNKNGKYEIVVHIWWMRGLNPYNFG